MGWTGTEVLAAFSGFLAAVCLFLLREISQISRDRDRLLREIDGSIGAVLRNPSAPESVEDEQKAPAEEGYCHPPVNAISSNDELLAELEAMERTTAGARAEMVCSHWDEQDARDAIQEELDLSRARRSLRSVR